MTRIWLVNWHFQSRITLWCRQSTNVSMGLCWQMPKFIVWRLWSIYFDHHLPLKPSIGKRRKQSCTLNMSEKKNLEKWRLLEELHVPTKKNFPRRHVIVYGYVNWWWPVAGWCSRDAPLHTIQQVTTVFSSLSMCWVSTHEQYRSKQKMKLRWLQRSQR